MGLIKAFTGSMNGVFADQWKDIITASTFEEQTIVAPGIRIATNSNHGTNTFNSSGVITQGSKIFVPENTAMFVLDQGRVADIVTDPGGYIYQNGQSSIFNGGKLGTNLIDEFVDRFKFGGQPNALKQVMYINLREIRGVKFGTRSPQPFHDRFYDVDLEVLAYGKFSLKIKDPLKFVQNYLPANTIQYSFADVKAREQLVSEFIQDFAAALNIQSENVRASRLPSQSGTIGNLIVAMQSRKASWENRFGITIESIGIQNIQFSEDSRELVKEFSAKRMDVQAYNGVSNRAAQIAIQQKIAQGIQDNGLGDSAGAILGMNIGNQFIDDGTPRISDIGNLDKQIEQVTKLKKLVDAGIMTEDEFNTKKREILGLS